MWEGKRMDIWAVWCPSDSRLFKARKHQGFIKFTGQKIDHNFQVHRRTWEAARGEDFSALTEGFADVRNSLEDPVREVDLDLDVFHVGQLQAQQLVLRGELELGIRLDPVFIQRPVGFKEPSFLLFPPQSVIWPVLLDICNKEAVLTVNSRTTERTKEVLKGEGIMDPKKLPAALFGYKKLLVLNSFDGI